MIRGHFKIEDRQAAADHTIEMLRQHCNPVLAGYGGDIAYGTEKRGSAFSIRGICLKLPDEWIGLQDASGQIRPDDSDTEIYGLENAINLLLACDPGMLELIGLRLEHILICDAGGQMILENSGIFLSKSAIFSFNSYAVRQRRLVAAMVEKGNAGTKEIWEEMMHLIRIYAMGLDLLQNRRVVTYREEEHELLMKIRRGEHWDKKRKAPSREYEHLLENYTGAFNNAAIGTGLPTEPDYPAANALMAEIVSRSS